MTSERGWRPIAPLRLARCASVLVGFALSLLAPTSAHAQTDSSTSDLFTNGVKALSDGRPANAVTALEALADRGAIDPVASYDRGLAYALRARIGPEEPGDLGRAVQGFEEARDLTRDPHLADDATHALTVVRSEIARRRMRAGEAADVDPGRSVDRALAALLSEETWAFVSVTMSALVSLAVFVRWLSVRPRLRVASGVVGGVASPLMLLGIAMTLATRHDRLSLHESVVVTANARPVDDRGIVLSGSHPLPEGARVEIVESRGPDRRVRFGSVDEWVSSTTLRELARRE